MLPEEEMLEELEEWTDENQEEENLPEETPPVEEILEELHEDQQTYVQMEVGQSNQLSGLQAEVAGMNQNLSAQLNALSLHIQSLPTLITDALRPSVSETASSEEMPAPTTENPPIVEENPPQERPATRRERRLARKKR